MTNIQAIDLLKGLEQSLDDYCKLNDEGKTAFRMAITALEVFGLSEQLPSAQPEPCEDVVSRKEAVREAKELFELGECHADEYSIIGMLNSLPSVHSEQRWIPCSEGLPDDGVYIIYAPDYEGGSSSAKECHDGVMFSKIKNGKWSVEHGYYKRPGCVKAFMPLPEPYRTEESDNGKEEAEKLAVSE